MTPEQIQELLDRLFEIGGAVASNGWRIAMRQTYTEAAMLSLVLIPAAASLAISGMIIRRRTGEKDDWHTPIGTLIAAASILAVVLTVPWIVGYLLNPEWYAVQMLLGLVH